MINPTKTINLSDFDDQTILAELTKYFNGRHDLEMIKQAVTSFKKSGLCFKLSGNSHIVYNSGEWISKYQGECLYDNPIEVIQWEFGPNIGNGCSRLKRGLSIQ